MCATEKKTLFIPKDPRAVIYGGRESKSKSKKKTPPMKQTKKPNSRSGFLESIKVGGVKTAPVGRDLAANKLVFCARKGGGALIKGCCYSSLSLPVVGCDCARNNILERGTG